MEKNRNKGENIESGNIEEILRERKRLDQIIQEKFKKQVTVLFTDICGYTKYMDTRGDVSGRAMLQKHNDITLPLIEKHNGVVIKTIGDAIMATFSDPLAAVKASMAIQNGLYEYNRTVDGADGIHVKIGLNIGAVLVDKADVYGGVVNVASRIQAQAGKDEILISRNIYEQVGGSEDVLCRYYGATPLKGIPDPLDLYRVIWRDDDTVSGDAPSVRATRAQAEKKTTPPLNVLQLEVTREDDRLKISAYEQNAGDVSTIRRYEEIPVPVDRIEARCREITETLNSANRRGRLTREVLVKLRDVGQVFSDELFTANVKEKVRDTGADHLILNLDDQLVHIPWELLHDGRQFLCQRFNMGRLVKTRQQIVGGKGRLLARPLKMLILADPKSDLKGAYKEGTQLRDFMDKNKDFINVSLRSDNITPEFIREKIRNFDLVHFAGHADYDRQNPGESGWRLTNGVIKAGEIIKMAGTAAMPALIFSNACQSARTEEWALKEYFQNEIFGLANAFILAGVKHYVGTFWEILDEPSRNFALEFHRRLLSGVTVGEALRQARLALIRKYGEETIVWASYLLYGDPTFNYMDQVEMIEPEEKQESPPVTFLDKPAGTEVRAREEVIDFTESGVPKKKRGRWAVAAGIALLSAFLFWGYPGFLREGTEKHEKAALAYYHEGDFEEALNVCKALEDRSPGLRLAYLIRGNIYFRRGEPDAAEAAFQKAVKAEKGTDLQNAEAYIGLGRIASVRKQTDTALNYYQEAAEASPASGLGYLSQALLLEDKGDLQNSLDLLGKAQKLAPGDHVLAAITNDTRKKVALARDQEKQTRIDQLVKELLKTMEAPPGAVPSDGWTSPPLTMWVMDFETRGYSLQEGEERLLASGITDRFIQHGRVQLVERALLDKLMEELKLGTSKLADRSAALSLGRILAARLILTGKLTYSGPRTQVSMRLIETETGRITAAVNESFGSAAPPSLLTEKLSGRLLKKLEALYPLRGKISKVREKEVGLNIGQRAGVKTGERFRVVDEDVILEVISIEPDISIARVVEGGGTLVEGMHVEKTK